MRLILSLVLAWALFAGTAGAQNASGFKRFETAEQTPKGGHTVIADPTSSAPERRVHRFTLQPGACSNQKHATTDTSDCTYNSMRSTAYEPDFKPKSDEWVAFSMYLPTDFPVGRQQAASGMYTFAYWHNLLCPHVALVSDSMGSSRLFLQTNRRDPTGKWNCVPDKQYAIADLRRLRGRWTKFELHTVFREDDTGLVELYLNGSKVLARNLRTIAPGPKKTFFVFGLYLCCTTGTDRITPATAYFAGLSRARSRDGLN